MNHKWTRRELVLLALASFVPLAFFGRAREASDGSLEAGSGTMSAPNRYTGPLASDPIESVRPEFGPDGHFREIQVFGDGTKHLIPIEDVVYGGPDKDDIPSIDDPKFVGASEWDTIAYDDERWVIGVEVNGERRAYPFQVLVWHEIVNDVFNGVPLLVTYCPLCGSGIIFRREINEGQVVEFGVTGRLYNSDLLMYDRATNTVWTQLTGTAVIGELTGQRLEVIPTELMTWGEWKSAYPDSKVLSRDTGYPRDYDGRPYGQYDETITIGFPVSGRDERLHPKTRITGVQVGRETYGAYPDEDVRRYSPLNDVLGSTPLLVVADPRAGGNVLVFERAVGGRVLSFSIREGALVDDQTRSRWNHEGEAIGGELRGVRLRERATVKAFWFAWFTFHQDTDLWQPASS